MAIKSQTYNVGASKVGSSGRNTKDGLMQKHQHEIDRVVNEAKKYADERKDALKKISDVALRRSAAR